jgi:hypothetical protein
MAARSEAGELMANPSKRKGTSFEVAVVDFLKSNGFPYAERRAQRGVNDAGDVAGVVGWTLEVKNCRTLELGPWMNEAHTEAANDGTSRFAVIHKRRQHGTAEAFVSMPLRLFAELLADAPISAVPTTTKGPA